MWSTKDSGNFVDLAAAAPSLPPTPKEEEDWKFSCDDDGGDDLQPLVYFLYSSSFVQTHQKSNDIRSRC
jgi:hypothetical protein